ncbi:YciI family protein [Corynebacterium glutamicum]|uniref:YciI family protein n=1 Tax=Corynebacterium glutamicum TaxID=1718 RepID=UPI001B8D09BE|nr:YciI family protein [Corynebacterium glutamicum]
MAAYAVTYAYVPENDEMAAIRPTHVNFLKNLHEQGTLLISGRLTECDPLGALLIIKGDSVEEVEAIMDQDPIYSGGFVSERLVRQWNVAFGAIAEKN